MHILIVDDEKRATEALQEFLNENYKTSVASHGEEALDILKKEQVDVVITDHNMPIMTGMELINQGRKLFPECFFIMLTAHSSLEHAIEALRTGADDYLLKPIDFSELEHRLLRIKQLLSLKNKNLLAEQQQSALESIIGSSSVICNIKELVKRVADVPTPILINGESGSGKELLAKAIHESGVRKAEPFVAINCATLSAELLESELFGHEKGSFTGATKAKIGKFELAREGTLFLDEIAELAPSLQAKLLRVLQEKEFYRVGGTRLLRTNCRILAATHQNLQEMAASGDFREDLLFRLNVLKVEVPSLNQRKEDIPALVAHFLKVLGPQLGTRSELASEVIDSLVNRHYVGNIRELKNEVERILVLNQDKSIIHLKDLQTFHGQGIESEKNTLEENLDYSKGLSTLVEDLERKVVETALNDYDFNQVHAAKALGITRGALQYKIQKYNLANKKIA